MIGVALIALGIALRLLVFFLAFFLGVALRRLTLLHVITHLRALFTLTVGTTALALLAFPFAFLRQIAFNPAAALVLVFLLLVAARGLLLLGAFKRIGRLTEQIAVFFFLFFFLLLFDFFLGFFELLLASPPAWLSGRRAWPPAPVTPAPAV